MNLQTRLTSGLETVLFICDPKHQSTTQYWVLLFLLHKWHQQLSTSFNSSHRISSSWRLAPGNHFCDPNKASACLYLGSSVQLHSQTKKRLFPQSCHFPSHCPPPQPKPQTTTVIPAAPPHHHHYIRTHSVHHRTFTLVLLSLTLSISPSHRPWAIFFCLSLSSYKPCLEAF